MHIVYIKLTTCVHANPQVTYGMLCVYLWMEQFACLCMCMHVSALNKVGAIVDFDTKREGGGPF